MDMWFAIFAAGVAVLGFLTITARYLHDLTRIYEVQNDTLGVLNDVIDRVIEIERQTFFCTSCKSGPWHKTWLGRSHDNDLSRALGPCCSGAD